MKKESFFAKLGRSFKSLFRSSVTGKKEINVLEEEAIQSPMRTIIKNFFSNTLAKVGLVGFIFILLFSFVGSLFFPMDPLYTEPILKNVQPGRGYLDYGSCDVKAEDIKQLASGATFSVVLTNDGKLCAWGQDQDDVLEIPSNADSGIKEIAVGDRHILALTNSGSIVGWGRANWQQQNLPVSIKGMMRGKVVHVYANEEYSAALTDQGYLYTWGSVTSTKLDIIPDDYQGHIVDADAAAMGMILLMDDNTVRAIGSGGDFKNYPEELENGEVKVVSVKAGKRNAMALDDEGNVYAWGGTSFNLDTVPDFGEKIVQIDSGKNAFFAVGESGKIYGWGEDAESILDIPEDFEAEQIFVDFFQGYAISKSGEMTAWGNEGFILGTDDQGRDVLTRLMHGGKITLLVGVIAVLISSAIGLTVGMIAGFKGGWIDNLLMRIAEIIVSIPFMPLVITLSYMIGSSMDSQSKMYLIMIILGLLSWPGLARLVRAQILIEREKDFVLAARAMGIKEGSIIIRHIMPNVISMVLVDMTLSYAVMMLQEAALSFLGFGVQPPNPSWGNMLNKAQQATTIENYWWQWILPAVCVLIAALSINLIGNALGDAIDPKSNEK
ncbi:ABC transporter permease subunit [Massilicoli timonensis]|uniref:ABC transporter permease subunit n=3 Tax=Massilicoli timonensis TaxID=2015901 RepID=A0ABT1SL15_9FIRM|nr:ABC transporter permease subunit [Massilicoli timonensis]MCQ5121822.1 ABC transporter permease subunit [Massilicoli timonensis]